MQIVCLKTKSFPSFFCCFEKFLRYQFRRERNVFNLRKPVLRKPAREQGRYVNVGGIAPCSRAGFRMKNFRMKKMRTLFRFYSVYSVSLFCAFRGKGFLNRTGPNRIFGTIYASTDKNIL